MRWHLTYSVTILAAALFLMGAGDDKQTTEPPPANPAYQEWSQFKPGSFVSTYQTVLVHQDPALMLESGEPPNAQVYRDTQKLLMVTPERAVVEDTAAEVGPGEEIVHPAVKLVFLNDHSAIATTKPPAGEETKLTEGDEAVQVNGKKIQTHWVESSIKAGADESVAKSWLSDEIPGGLVRETVKKYKNGKLIFDSDETVIDYQAPS